jgi:hypothetical protein
MEPLKVLVMCQRKKSYIYEVPTGGKIQDAFAVDIMVKKLENYIYNYYQSRNVQIEYLIEYRNNIEEYEAEYKFTFNPSSRHTDIRLKSYEFMRDHINHYDMIILQTCPLILFIDNFKYLSWILKPDGVLTIKAFSPHSDTMVDIKNKVPNVYREVLKYFYNINEDTYGIITKED